MVPIKLALCKPQRRVVLSDSGDKSRYCGYDPTRGTEPRVRAVL